MTARTKPTPGHKLKSYQFGVCTNCECGWQSGTWYGKGGRHSALDEWHMHKDKCSAALRLAKGEA